MMTTNTVPSAVRALMRAYAYLSTRTSSPIQSSRVALSFFNRKNALFTRQVLSSPNPDSGHIKSIINTYSKVLQPHMARIFSLPITPDDTKVADLIRPELQATTPMVEPLEPQRCRLLQTAFLLRLSQSIQSHYQPSMESYQQVQLHNLLGADMKQPPLAASQPSYISRNANSIKWFHRLINETPIIFVLVHTNRLFADTSLHQIDPAANRISSQLDTLKAKSWTQRSYHFAEVLQLPLFTYFLGGDQDALVKKMLSRSRVEVTDMGFHPVSKVKKVPLLPQSRQEVGYDLKYTTFSVVTIEDDVKTASHRDLMRVLEDSKDDYEIVGVRISTKLDWTRTQMKTTLAHVPGEYSITTATPNTSDTTTVVAKDTYETILTNKQRPTYDPSNLELLMKWTAELGLTEVARGSDCIYLLNDT